jgi:hypothetical protein
MNGAVRMPARPFQVRGMIPVLSRHPTARQQHVDAAHEPHDADEDAQYGDPLTPSRRFRSHADIIEHPTRILKSDVSRSLCTTPDGSNTAILSQVISRSLNLNEETMVAPDKPKLPVILSEGWGSGRERRIPAQS